MSAPALALRPPCGRPGSPSRPRHRCISGRGGRGGPYQATRGGGPAAEMRPGGSRGGKLADGRVFSSCSWGKAASVSRRVKRPFLDVEGALCVVLFSGGILCCLRFTFSTLKRSRAFPFEKLCSSSHTACVGVGISPFSMTKCLKKQGTCLTVSRQPCSLFLFLERFTFFKDEAFYIRGTVAAESVFASPKPRIVPIKARWGKGRGPGGGGTPSRASRGGSPSPGKKLPRNQR